jgi:hypothetical protein
MKKGAGRRKSGPPLNILAATFYLLGESNGVALLDRSSCRIEFGPQWRQRAVGRELGSKKGGKNVSFLELRLYSHHGENREPPSNVTIEVRGAHPKKTGKQPGPMSWK